jgi:hypothetical protein
MLDRGNFHESMRRLLAFFKPPSTPEEVKQNNEYLEAVYESVSRMDGLLFDTVTKELAKSLTQGRRPVPSQFYAVYEKLRDVQPKTAFKCVTCGTTGWVYVMLMDQHTSQLERFSKPCPDCRRTHPLRTAPLRQGWIEAEMPPKESPDESTRKFVNALLGKATTTPQAALDEITAMWHRGDFQLDRMTDYLKRVTPPKYVEEVRKNELVRQLVTALPPRETPASGPPAGAVGAGSGGGSPSHVEPPPKDGLFPDGSRLDDPDIPF